MKQLNLKIQGVQKINPDIFIDGKHIKCKKNDFGNYVYSCQTDKEVVEIEVYKYLEINSKIWWLAAFFFYVISIFGILNIGYDKRCVSVNCKLKVKLNDVSNVVLKANSSSSKEKAIEIQSDCEVEEIENAYFVDARAKKRLIALRIMKVLSYVAIVAALIIVIINRK